MPKSVTPHDRPQNVSRAPICLRIGVVRFLVPNTFLELCCCYFTAVVYTSVPMDYGAAVRLASFQLKIGRKDFGQLAGWVQRIDFGLGAGANPNAQIGYPTRSPQHVSRTSVLRIGIVRVLQPGQFEPGTCQVRAWNLSSAQERGRGEGSVATRCLPVCVRLFRPSGSTSRRQSAYLIATGRLLSSN